MGQQRVTDIEHKVIGMMEIRFMVADEQPRFNVELHVEPALPALARLDRHHARRRRSGRNPAERPLDHGDDFGRVDIPNDSEHPVARSVISLEEPLGYGRRQGLPIGCPADGGKPIGVRLEGSRDEGFVQ